MADIIFYIIALSACTCAFFTVTSRHIFHNAVWLALCLLCIAGVYFYLDAQFIGVIQVLVYIGGIITLFIFAIKLTSHIGDQSIQQTNRQLIPAVLAVALLFGILFTLIMYSPWTLSQPQKSLTLKEIGQSLMTAYILPFEFISVILLAVMIGAIVIGKVKK